MGGAFTHGPPLFHSWEPHHGKKRSRGPKSDDDGFEIVPIEDPGESGSAPSGMGGDSGNPCVGIERGLDSSLVKHRILDPEGLALGAIIASSKKAKRDLIDNSFNR